MLYKYEDVAPLYTILSRITLFSTDLMEATNHKLKI